MKKSLNICHLYPDVLNLYGDNGNITCLKTRIEARGIECKVQEIKVGDVLDEEDFDIFFMGGGQDFEQEILIADANEKKKKAISNAIEKGKVFLTICGGYQLLGKYYQTKEGKKFPFLDCIDIYTIGHEKRMVGDYIFYCDDIQDYIVGFENHSGRTYLGKNLRPLGKIKKGFGNNGKDGSEGIRYKNVFGTYSHGPILPKNPKFCDLLIKTALEVKYDNEKHIELLELNDEFENAAHEYMKNRLLKQS